MLGVGPLPNDARATSLTHAVVGFSDVEVVGGAVVLALAIDRGIADRDVVEPALGKRIAAELLADDFARPVNDGAGRRAVGEKGRRLDEVASEAGPVAIDGAGRREHQLLHAGDAAGLDDVLRAAHVDVESRPWVAIHAD